MFVYLFDRVQVIQFKSCVAKIKAIFKKYAHKDQECVVFKCRY